MWLNVKLYRMFAKEGIIYRHACTLKENEVKHSKYLAVA